jgi:hypothetical protein
MGNIGPNWRDERSELRLMLQLSLTLGPVAAAEHRSPGRGSSRAGVEPERRCAAAGEFGSRPAGARSAGVSAASGSANGRTWMCALGFSAERDA